MTETMAGQLVEIMPELANIAPWHSVGKRRRLNELGIAAQRRLADEVFVDPEEAGAAVGSTSGNLPPCRSEKLPRLPRRFCQPFRPFTPLGRPRSGPSQSHRRTHRL